MERVCPECKYNLGSNDINFCSNCSKELPESLVIPSKNHRREILFEQENKEKISIIKLLAEPIRNFLHIINIKQLLVIFGALTVLGVPGYFLYTRLNYGEPLQLSVQPKDPNYVNPNNVVSVETEYITHIFGADKITKYVPYDVDYYFEAHDLKAFASQLVSLDPFYEEYISELQEYTTDHFAFFVQELNDERYFTFILFPDDAVLGGELPDLPDYEWLTVARVGAALVLTTRPEVVQEVTDVYKGMSKSVDQNAVFASAKSTSPKSGKVFMVTFTDAGRDYLKSYSNPNISEDMKKVLEKYKGQNSNNLVVL